MKNNKNVGKYLFAKNGIKVLPEIINHRRKADKNICVFYIDHFFKDSKKFEYLKEKDDLVFFVDTTDEPKTSGVDSFVKSLKGYRDKICCLVGIGGGATLDTTKAVANLLTNEGKAEDYQGWDLVKNPGVYKIGVPTISGTGAEASRTCVMMNVEKNLKLGMNSEHTVYDQLILDPVLSETVDRNQYFYTAMDTYIHCIESLAGSYRNVVGDTFSENSLDLCRKVFNSEDMMSYENRERTMLASYLGGLAIANSMVGVVHPFSAGLSVVLDIHHCIGNCIVMNVMEEFYPNQTEEFKTFLEKQNIKLPEGICADLTDEQYEKLYLSTVIHEKPLANALGPDFKNILSRKKVKEVFKRM